MNLKARALAIMLIGIMLFCSCGSSESVSEEQTSATESEETEIYQLGDTVSTDLADFTLEKASFAYYISQQNEDFAMPVDVDDGNQNDIAASMGHVFVAVTFAVNNKDRTYINIGNDWKFEFVAIYNGEEYQVNGYDSSTGGKDGRIGGLCFKYAAKSSDGGKSYVSNRPSNNVLQNPGVKKYRTFGIASFDPESLDDSFELRIPVLNSAGEYEYFTYEINN